jgi:putative hydrolase of the HAD superfamily
MIIRAIIWDVGGVLVRTEDISSRTLLAESLGQSAFELENNVYSSEIGILAQLGKIGIEEYWDKTLQSFGLSLADLADFRQRFWAGDRLDENLVAEIRRLHQVYKTGLLSNALPGLRSLIQDDWQIADAFDVLIISSEIGLMKPDPQVYQLAAEELEISLNDAVFIDDNPLNIDAAKSIGMHVIHFHSPVQAVADLEALLQQVQ